jgi:hypothetical protein
MLVKVKLSGKSIAANIYKYADSFYKRNAFLESSCCGLLGHDTV